MVEAEFTERKRERSLVGTLGGMRSGLVRFLWPPHCLACDKPVGDEGGLCPTCWIGLSLIEKPYCARLGTPFTYDLGEGVLSAEAIADPPPFDRLRAVARLDEIARRLVHALKYRDRLDLARWMAAWMGRAGRELVASADLVVPVPLHRRRLWSRRFNQSAALADAIATTGRRRYEPGALARVKRTRQQVGLSAAERARNVSGAFKVVPGREHAVADRRILLVDDVYTTGETSKAASRALLRAGAAAVDVLVFALVVRD